MSELTTPEELEALPEGSIVRADNGQIYMKERKYERTGSWWVIFNEQFDFKTEDIELPAAVLYEPKGSGNE
jgi:hypothetical protein